MATLAHTIPNSGQILQQVTPPPAPAPKAAPDLTIAPNDAATPDDSTPFAVTRLQIDGNTVFATATLHALIADPRGLQDAARPAPGGSCPLCEFPTFHWAVAATLAPAMLRRILAAFPAWQPEQGLCSRCLETYEASAALELAAAQ